MPAATMSPLDWSAIVARAQQAHFLRRWEAVQREVMGDMQSAESLARQAAKAEARVLELARVAGCHVETVELGVAA